MAPMSFGGADGQIAYSRGPYNEWPDQIWAQDLDGGGLTKLTFSPSARATTAQPGRLGEP